MNDHGGRTMSDAAKVTIAGRTLVCRHCDHDQFHQMAGTIDRLGLGGWVHLEGALGHEVTIHACGRCGFAHLFVGVPEVRQVAPPAKPGPVPEEACLSCGAVIPGDAKACPKCGWTWEAGKEG